MDETINNTVIDNASTETPGTATNADSDLDGLDEIDAAGAGPSGTTFPLTDAGNAERFAKMIEGTVRSIRESESSDPADGWIAWDPNRGVWCRDDDGAVVRTVIQMARDLAAEARIALAEANQIKSEMKKKGATAAAKALLTWAQKTESARGIFATLRLARSMPGITLREADLDADDWLLCVLNGTLDLRTGTLRPHDPADMITVQVPITFDPAAQCPTWLRFLAEVTAGDPAVVQYLRQLVGYCLTGDTSAQTFQILWGSGANGKSTFLAVLRGLLGSRYMREAAQGTFVASKYRNEARYDLAALKDCRVVTTSETRADGFLDVGTVKAMSGGDELTCRNLRGSFFSYVPHFKGFLVCNARPKIKEDSQGVWRRLRLIPFTQDFTGREDRELPAKLLAELPGILNWGLEGLNELRTGWGDVPDIMKAAAEEYREQESPIARFLTECYDESRTWQPTAEIRTAYRSWCAQRGMDPWSDRALSEALGGHGLKSEKRGKDRTRGWCIGAPRTETPPDLPDMSELLN